MVELMDGELQEWDHSVIDPRENGRVLSMHRGKADAERGRVQWARLIRCAPDDLEVVPVLPLSQQDDDGATGKTEAFEPGGD